MAIHRVGKEVREEIYWSVERGDRQCQHWLYLPSETRTCIKRKGNLLLSIVQAEPGEVLFSLARDEKPDEIHIMGTMPEGSLIETFRNTNKPNEIPVTSKPSFSSLKQHAREFLEELAREPELKKRFLDCYKKLAENARKELKQPARPPKTSMQEAFDEAYRKKLEKIVKE